MPGRGRGCHEATPTLPKRGQGSWVHLAGLVGRASLCVPLPSAPARPALAAVSMARDQPCPCHCVPVCSCRRQGGTPGLWQPMVTSQGLLAEVALEGRLDCCLMQTCRDDGQGQPRASQGGKGEANGSYYAVCPYAHRFVCGRGRDHSRFAAVQSRT